MKKLLELDPLRRINWDDISCADWLEDDRTLLNIENVNTPTITANSQSNIKTIDNNRCINYIPKYGENIRENTYVFNKNQKHSKVQYSAQKPDMFNMFNTDDNNSPNTRQYISLNDVDLDINSDVNADVDDVNDESKIRYANLINTRTKSLSDKRSEPIPIMANNKNRISPKSYGDRYGGNRRVEYGASSPLSYGQSPQLYGLRGESVGDVYSINEDDININDLSVIDNNPGDQYSNLIKRQKAKVTGSGLVDINDVDGMLIANIPERTTAYEYFSKGSTVWGSYLYSRSAPVASTIVQGLSNVAKTTIEAIGIVSSK
jgi:hypothetical protein